MTGFGSAKGTAAGLPISIEIRSVNNRYLDIGVKLPRGFLFAEDRVKNVIQNRVARGKLDVYISIDSAGSEQTHIRVNETLAASYREAIFEIGSRFDLPLNLSALDLARFPDVMTPEKEETDQDRFAEELESLLEAALTDFNSMRGREGERLKQDLLSKVNGIEKLVDRIEERAPETLKGYRERLENRMREVLSEPGIAQERILAEAAIFADRVATDEELVRLKSHISQFRLMMEQGSPIGRKLDFLIQEFNREANTTGSKCQDSEIAYLVVDLKSEIEKIREQVQNLE
ncbi:MAG: YicC family protein [Oscillospiraceae bacterium]|nr:YicC family protein [Oscillospiraceae bacterium]